MKKITLLLLFIILYINPNSTALAQKNSRTNKIGTVYKKGGTKITGNVKNFYTSPTFDRVDPLILFKILFSGDNINYFGSGRPNSIKYINVKPNGAKKFEKIPFEEIDHITISQTNKKGETKTTDFVAFSGENFYGKKRDKKEKNLLPSLTKGEVINTYGTIYPYRYLTWAGPFLFELGTPLPVANLAIENKKNNLVLSTSFIEIEKTYTKRKAERRKKSDNNKNYNTIEELFGDCPEAKALIDKFYIKRIEDKAERKQAAIKYNELIRKNVKNFRQVIRKDRKKATPEFYFQMYEFDLLEIIKAYEKNCLPIDEFDPRHENYRKEFDILLRQKKDSL